MREMDRRVGLLRLLVADLDARQRQGQQARDQLRGQLTRLVDFAVRANLSVPNALAALAEAGGLSPDLLLGGLGYRRVV